MKKNIIRKAGISCILTLSLATSFICPDSVKAATAKINKSSLTLIQGKRYNLKVKGISGKVTWKSSNKKVVSVSQKGKVTAKRPGKAKVTAVVKSKKFTCKITVKRKYTVTTQKPTTTQSPTSTKKPTATQRPTATQTPGATQRPTTTQLPASTKKPTATQVPAVSQKPVSTASPSASKVTEESAYNTLNSLRNTYPEGMTLTNSYHYYSPQFGNGYGCYGFAAKLSDTVFGTTRPYQVHTSFDKIKVGDNIRIGNYHSVIVLTKNANDITVVEGNYNSSVHWDRKITSSFLASSGFTVYTRY